MRFFVMINSQLVRLIVSWELDKNSLILLSRHDPTSRHDLISIHLTKNASTVSMINESESSCRCLRLTCLHCSKSSCWISKIYCVVREPALIIALQTFHAIKLCVEMNNSHHTSCRSFAFLLLSKTFFELFISSMKMRACWWLTNNEEGAQSRNSL